MTKLTLTLCGEDDAAALRVLRRAFEGIAHDHIGQELHDIHLCTAGYTGSWDDGNYLCDVARFEPVGNDDATAGEIDRLAATFTKHVRAFFTEEDDVGAMFATVLDRNRAEPDPSICHTHDFCDANELMAAAWNDCFPHEPFCPQNTFHAQLWSAAWQQARKAEFSPSSDSPAA